MHILLTEDDALIASGLTYALETDGHIVTHCDTAASSIAAAERTAFDLALLDVSLPDGTGFDVCRRLREIGDTAVIFLTAADDEGNTIRAFDMGADDYIVKPFRVRELLARIKAVSRRIENADTADIMTLGDVTINAKTAKVTRGGGEIELTALEYRLLLTFAANRGRILTRSQLLESIWDANSAGETFVNDNTLTVYIKRLREKLGGGVNIETVRGVGYRA
ncbi:MAG: response regulator transcription factor [Oscillospiraceae bacterium]|nr:response regulator transcription factor [Oscillospiraceae bacterium]